MLSHDPIYCIRHSLSHILAQAIQRYIDPKVQLGTGPAIENGFYYDIKFSDNIELKEENLKEIQKTMEGIIKEGQQFGSYKTKDLDEAMHICKLIDQNFKQELLNKFANAGETNYSFYYNFVDAQMFPRLEKNCKSEYISTMNNITEYILSKNSNLKNIYITFLDLCEGGHVDSTKEISDGSFKLDKISGAYRQGNEGNPMMTRIYGLAFASKNELKSHLEFIEEAKRRDHRTIGQKMKLFTISDYVGSGLPLFQPNGMIIRKELEDFLRSLHKNRGYDRVWTPHLAKEELYKVSGHAGHYLDDMFSVYGGTSKENFFLKPMSCPHHMQIFADNSFSYRDMPIRYFEPATVYRDEKTGQLSGLTRVRSITQDDGHLFCRAGQINNEVSSIVTIIKEFYTTMGMIDGYRVRLSLRGEDKENYLGSDEIREIAENALIYVCKSQNLPFREGKGEAAFYGPKLDFMFKDAIGREHQLATCQVDFQMPERFELGFTNEEGQKERPVVIHRAISGSLERFMGVMIEHFAGDFPLRLSPEQIRIIPVVVEKFDIYINKIYSDFRTNDIRIKIDNSTDSFAKKIRNAETEKVYYILIIGEEESNNNSLSIRNVRTKEQFKVNNYQDFLDKVKEEVLTRKL